jgi:hypothetical protein
VTQLTGYVRLAGGSPPPAATVEVLNAGGVVVDQVRVGEDGGFTFHLTRGRWSFFAYDPEGHRARGQLAISDDDRVADLTLELS